MSKRGRMRLARRDVGDIVATQQLFDADFVAADTFHQEFLAPLDIRWRQALCLWRDDTGDCYLTVLRAPGRDVSEPVHLRVLARLKSHLVRGAALAEQTAQLRAEAILGEAALAETLGRGTTLEQAARQRSMKISVARSQISVLPGITGCKRQQDSMRLL